ncbi:MAG: class I SAM-dependent methyltransferase [Phocaeicola sp.]|uniref:class I SAM-dependent methyltransferase n=1 Tax=Phocaeicola sp. TaxID=2773926 RepID=UPI003F9F46A9
MIESKLSDLPETMLITLWAKAEETKRADALLRDEKAAEIIKRIEYDFSKFSKARFSQAGCCVRASLIDTETRNFLDNHPDAVVIQLGAGIDARFERMQRPPVTHWYDLDLEEAIRLRRQLLAESEQNTYITSSMFDYGWTEIVKSHGKPVLIIIEGVLMYFDPEKIRAFFQELCMRFDNATILFDMLAFSLVGHSRQHDTLKKVGKDLEFKWSLLDTREMETWNPKLRLEKEFYMSKYDHGRFPIFFRMLYKIPYFFRRYNQRVVRLKITQKEP